MQELFFGLGVVGQIAVVILAFSVLIFVHELGHYLAARLVGVRVERFFIGFDIYGLALSREYKGTVYGVGILPLGGYCALAGQNDDPRKEKQTNAPDELQNKSVGARFLVFAGGVIMNLAFGFFVLVAAYMYGIPFVPAVFGQLDPSSPAAVAGFQPGDRILSVNDRRVESFEDMVEAVALEGAGEEMTFVIRRPVGDKSETLTITVKGQNTTYRGNLPSIGASPLYSNRVAGVIDSPDFQELRDKLAVGDSIIAVNGTPISDTQGERLASLFRNYPDSRARLTIKKPSGETADVEIPLETAGEWDMGMRRGVGIAVVVPGSPADKAGFKPGDMVVAAELDGQVNRFAKISDLQALVIAAALRPIQTGISRDGEQKSLTISPIPSPRGDNHDENGYDTLLGVTGRMGSDFFLVEQSNNVELRPGDQLLTLGGKDIDTTKTLGEQIEALASTEVGLYIAPRAGENELPEPDAAKVPGAKRVIRLSPRVVSEVGRPMIGVELAAGPVVFVEPDSYAATQLGGAKLYGGRLTELHYSPDMSKMELTFVFPEGTPGGTKRIVKAATPDEIRNDPIGSGLVRRLPISLRSAEEVHPLGLFPAMGAAAQRWVKMTLMVYRVLHRLVIRAIPLEAVGGPVKLFHIIKIADDRGFAYLLYIVALISVNLGVFNLLPFPVLDGGHLLFLLIELFMGRPPPPRIREFAQYIGIACLLMLMLTVTGYDILHLIRGTG